MASRKRSETKRDTATLSPTPSYSESSIVSNGDGGIVADRSGSIVSEDLRSSSPDLQSTSTPVKSTSVKGRPADKENDPSQPPFTQRPFVSISPSARMGKKGEGSSSHHSPSYKPKRKANHDLSDSSEELQPKKKHVTRRMRKGFDIEAAFTDDRASREEFQDKILAAIHTGNEAFQQSAKETAEFQRSFLTVLGNLTSK
jgi:hypothetical protein